MARKKSKMEKYTPMVYQQICNICWSIKNSSQKIHKALLKDLMKLERGKI